MWVKRTVVLAAFAVLAPVASAQAPSATASVEGDVYLTMQSGDTKKGTGVTVFLLRNGPELRQWADSECPKRNVDIVTLDAYMNSMIDSSLGAGGSRTKRDLYIKKAGEVITQKVALQKETLVALRSAVAQNATDTTGSGMNAHYSFVGEQPGKYVLFGEWKVGEHQYAWWAPVDLATGKTVRRDLDNSAENHESIYCGALSETP